MTTLGTSIYLKVILFLLVLFVTMLYVLGYVHFYSIGSSFTFSPTIKVAECEGKEFAFFDKRSSDGGAKAICTGKLHSVIKKSPIGPPPTAAN